MRHRDAFLELLSPALARTRRERPVRSATPAERPMPRPELTIARVMIARTR